MGLTVDVETPSPRYRFCKGASHKGAEREGNSPYQAHNSVVFPTFSGESVGYYESQVLFGGMNSPWGVEVSDDDADQRE